MECMKFIWCTCCKTIAAAHMRPHGPWCTNCGKDYNYDPGGRYFGDVWTTIINDQARNTGRVFLCPIHGLSSSAFGTPDTGAMCKLRTGRFVCNSQMSIILPSRYGVRPSIYQAFAANYEHPNIPADEPETETEKRLARLAGVRPVWGEDQ